MGLHSTRITHNNAINGNVSDAVREHIDEVPIIERGKAECRIEGISITYAPRKKDIG
jgi:hypothetical protein